MTHDLIEFDATFFRGRVAMMAALKAMGIGMGDEVILQAYTCVAVPEGILASGAKPHFVDIDEDAVTMSPQALEDAINPKTRAVVIQHTFGLMANMPELMDIARRHKLWVIEDCAHTYWSEIDGKRAGTLGDAAIYSLEWGKPLIVGVGGGLAINNPDLKAPVGEIHDAMRIPGAMRDMRLTAQYVAFSALYSPANYWRIKKIYETVSRFGMAEASFNDLELDVASDFDLQLSPAAVKRLKRILPRFKPDWAHNEAVAEAYRSVLNSVAGWKEVKPIANSRTMYQRLPYMVDDKERALAAARDAGFELSDWFESAVDPLNEQTFHLVGYVPKSCPNAEHAASRIVSLTCGEQITPMKAAKGVAKLADAYRNSAELVHEG